MKLIFKGISFIFICFDGHKGFSFKFAGITLILFLQKKFRGQPYFLATSHEPLSLKTTATKTPAPSHLATINPVTNNPATQPPSHLATRCNFINVFFQVAEKCGQPPATNKHWGGFLETLVNTNPKIYSQLSCTKFDVSNCMLCLRDKRQSKKQNQQVVPQENSISKIQKWYKFIFLVYLS